MNASASRARVTVCQNMHRAARLLILATVSPLLRRACVSPAGRFVAGGAAGARMTWVMRVSGISKLPAVAASVSFPSRMARTSPTARS